MDWPLLYKATQLLFVGALAVACWRSREPRVLLLYFLFLLANDEVRRWLIGLREGDPGPLAGWLRVDLHVDQILFLSIGGGFAAVVAHYFRGGKLWLLSAGGLFLCGLVLVLGYPTASPGRIYTLAALITLSVTWLMVLSGALKLRVRPGPNQLAIMVILGADSVTTLQGFVDLAWAGLSGVVAAWDAMRATYVVAFLFCTVVYGALELRQSWHDVPGRA